MNGFLKNKDLLAGIMFMVIGIVFAVGAYNYQIGTAARMGPGFFPRILGFLMAGLGVVIAGIGLKNQADVEVADWSTAVEPFWDVVIDSAITPQAIVGLIKAGRKTIEAALSLRLMSNGYRSGLIRFGLVAATKYIRLEQSDDNYRPITSNGN